MTKMNKTTKKTKKTSGLLVCGACVVPADLNASGEASVAMLADSIKGIFARK